MEAMVVLLFNIVNEILAIFAFVLFLCSYNKGAIKIKLIPRNLRCFLITSFIFCNLFQTIVSIVFFGYFIVFRVENDVIFKTLRLLQGVSSQHVRGSLLIAVIERIIATVFVEKYSSYSKTYSTFVILTFSTCFLTFVHFSFTIGWIYFENVIYIYFGNGLAILTHFFTLIVARVLYTKNQQMYKLLAYRVTLKTRYQIFENIKVIKVMWSIIVIFTFVAPIGVILTLIYNIALNSPAPGGLFFVTYNLAFIIIFIYLQRNIFKSSKTAPFMKTKDALPVISALGKQMPTTYSTDIYFTELQKRWDSFNS